MTPEEKLKAIQKIWDALAWELDHAEHCGWQEYECSCELDKFREKMNEALDA